MCIYDLLDFVMMLVMLLLVAAQGVVLWRGCTRDLVWVLDVHWWEWWELSLRELTGAKVLLVAVLSRWSTETLQVMLDLWMLLVFFWCCWYLWCCVGGAIWWSSRCSYCY